MARATLVLLSALALLVAVVSADAGDYLDFGLNTFTERDKFTAYNKQVSGELVGYGFYIPDFDTIGLDGITDATSAVLEYPAHPDLPFKFVGLDYNPFGHPGGKDGTGWLVPHFDIHNYLMDVEYIKGISCSNGFPPCQTTTVEEARFAYAPSADLFPSAPFNYEAHPDEWVPQMGAHWADVDHLQDATEFSTDPAPIYGSYNGQLIFYEPMVAKAIFEDVKTNGARTFDWPAPERYPTPGKYFTKYTISYESGDSRYNVYFHDLVVSQKQTTDGQLVYTGARLAVPSDAVEEYDSAATSKNCIISTNTAFETGYEVAIDATVLCCRSIGAYSAGNCNASGCTPSTVTNYYNYNDGDGKCFYNCYAASPAPIAVI